MLASDYAGGTYGEGETATNSPTVRIRGVATAARCYAVDGSSKQVPTSKGLTVRTDLTDITIVMDRSGSMSSIRDDAEGGLNSFIDEQQRAGDIRRDRPDFGQTRKGPRRHERRFVAGHGFHR